MFSADSASSAIPVVIVLVFLVFHLRYLPKSLEDLDSINFALGVRHFDVAQHQPHPPGYPLFILIAKAAHAIIPSETSALSVVSIVAGILGIFAIAALCRRLSDDEAFEWPLAATLVAITSPLYWLTASRPLSDLTGLTAAIAVQVLTLGARTPAMMYAAGFSAGLATGLRSQVAWLTVPLLIVAAALRSTKNIHQDSSTVSTVSSVVEIFNTLLTFVAGVLVWAVPLVLVSGGASAYWKALSFQGTADLDNIQMLWTRHGARDVADALYFAFVAPWATWYPASVVLLLAALGFGRLAVRRRQALLVVSAAFGPYLVFDLLFQETFTSRYALPLVVPLAYLATEGARILPWRLGLLVVAPVVMFDAHVGGTSLAAYASQKAPAFRLLDDMVATDRREAPVLAMDRRQSFDFRRPLVWAGKALPVFASTLAAPPQHEWLEAVKYWNSGGRAPVWFVVDPRRTAIDLVQHGEPATYDWPLKDPVLLGGVRPNDMDWYRVDRPEWYVAEGWALTPESAGVAEADHRGLSFAPIDAWMSRDVMGGQLVIGGRNLEPTLRPRVTLMLSGKAHQEWELPPGPFLKVVPVPLIESNREMNYLTLTIGASPAARVAIEQFDASSRRPIFGYGEGWHEQEFNPRTGVRWRWLSERGELRFAAPTPRLMLHLEGESPRQYFSRGSRLLVRSGDRVVFDDVLTADFSLNVPVPNGTEVVTLETDQVFQPADRSRRSADRRHLGLRVFKCELRPVS